MKTASATAVQQSTNAVVMIRPHRFYPNPETAADNAFQQAIAEGELPAISAAAQREFDAAVETLRTNGVTVHVVDDTATPEKPDAVFPNNWFSTHHDGRVVLYPMYSAARRRERRHDVIDELRKQYHVAEVVDYSACEEQGHCLEGTGSLVLDHVNKIAYASLSQRTHSEVLLRFCDDFGYEPVTFRSQTADGRPVYHTNVVMCVGTEFAIFGAEMVPDEAERIGVQNLLESTGKEVVEVTEEQINEFAGNAIELHDAKNEKLLVLSARAAAALSAEQRGMIERYARVVPLTLPTIELAGGSARCMIATVHLPALGRR